MNDRQRMIDEALEALRRYCLSAHADAIEAELKMLRDSGNPHGKMNSGKQQLWQERNGTTWAS